MTDEDRELLIEDVKKAEGWRAKAYQDSVGVWSVGFGTNLQELVIDKKLGGRWLLTALQIGEGECRRSFPWFDTLSSVRQRALVEMHYQLGLSRMLKFRHFLEAMAHDDFETAANEMLDSLWHRQTPTRVERLADMMRKG